MSSSLCPCQKMCPAASQSGSHLSYAWQLGGWGGASLAHENKIVAMQPGAAPLSPSLTPSPPHLQRGECVGGAPRRGDAAHQAVALQVQPLQAGQLRQLAGQAGAPDLGASQVPAVPGVRDAASNAASNAAPCAPMVLFLCSGRTTKQAACAAASQLGHCASVAAAHDALPRLCAVAAAGRRARRPGRARQARRRVLPVFRACFWEAEQEVGCRGHRGRADDGSDQRDGCASASTELSTGSGSRVG